MPELPEVETTRRGLRAHAEGRRVVSVALREGRLRWPVPPTLPEILQGQAVRSLERRAKYLLFRMDHGTLLVHLGMSGSLRVLLEPQTPAKHDHIDIELDSGAVLRYNDPRRFGSFQWFQAGEEITPLGRLGPEPLSIDFDGRRLFELSRGRKLAVKPFIMDGATVVGVGNIYASEALYLAGIRPDRAASRVSEARYELLSEHIKQVLTNAIEQGGTTLRDFVGGDGKPGYFAQQLYVYGRSGAPCKACGTPLRDKVIGQRASVYCIACQR
ncbi:bifunctional DNA-formamidopyrimidine glycosylase/DNA-(apurinic or apyrimidinic site) lyase [Congregibacter sp.]|uniref:bifunctional DNA-formamidopyrimidine glycosylase/DNA-(apurinic or apyrimidinic site) lyase n=1 Tax=Congregibacter sp. TaxID=2744308 RepID=UPI00385BD678